MLEKIFGGAGRSRLCWQPDESFGPHLAVKPRDFNLSLT